MGSADLRGDFESGGTSAAPSQGTVDDQKASRAKTGQSPLKTDGKSKTDDESSPGGYTARLLQAKKRALKNERDSEEGE